MQGGWGVVDVKNWSVLVSAIDYGAVDLGPGGHPCSDSCPPKFAHHCTGLKGTPLSRLLPGMVKK